MDKELKAKWVEALRSGQYQQLAPGHSDWRRHGKHCCMGVLGELVGKQKEMDDLFFGGALSDLGISHHIMDTLINMNDREGKSFAEIADYIEANL